MKNLTALEWLVEWMHSNQYFIGNDLLEAVKQAKEITEKIWKTDNPLEEGDYICRMANAYIKMCHWNGAEWLDMWEPALDGEVKEWMEIPYDNNNMKTKEVKELLGEVDMEKRFQDILNTETPQEMDIMLLLATKHGFKYGYKQAIEDTKEFIDGKLKIE